MAEAGASEVEPRPVVEAGRPQERHEHQQLDGDPGGRAQAQPGLLSRRVRRALGVVGDGTVGDEVGDQDPDRHQVVGDRRPHHRAEPAPGVEDLTDQGEHPVEEHLRQAEPRERDDRVALRGQLGLVVLRGQEHVHHPRRGHDQHHGDRREEERRQRDDPVGVGLAAVGVGSHRPHQLRDQDGVEDAAGQQDVEHVRDGVADRELVGVQQVAQRGREQQGPQVAAQPGDHRAGSHHRAGGEQLLLVACGVPGHRASSGVMVIGRARPARAPARGRPRHGARRTAAACCRRHRPRARCRGSGGPGAARWRGTADRPPRP